MLALSTDIFSLADLDGPYGQFLILDRINNAVCALTGTIPFQAGHFLATGGTRITGKHCNTIEDSPEIFFWCGLEILLNGALEGDFICGQLSSILERFITAGQRLRYFSFFPLFHREAFMINMYDYVCLMSISCKQGGEPDVRITRGSKSPA